MTDHLLEPKRSRKRVPREAAISREESGMTENPIERAMAAERKRIYARIARAVENAERPNHPADRYAYEGCRCVRCQEIRGAA